MNDVRLTDLSPREQEVATEAALGKTNREIAEMLSISRGTVANHLTSIYARLGIQGQPGESGRWQRVQLARWYIEQVQPEQALRQSLNDMIQEMRGLLERADNLP